MGLEFITVTQVVDTVPRYNDFPEHVSLLGKVFPSSFHNDYILPFVVNRMIRDFSTF